MERDDLDKSWDSRSDFSDDYEETVDGKKVKIDSEAKAIKKEKRKQKALNLLKQATTVKETNVFLSLYEQICELDTGNSDDTIISKVKYLIKKNGLEKEDPRIKPQLDELLKIEREGKISISKPYTFSLFNSPRFLYLIFVLFMKKSNI